MSAVCDVAVSFVGCDQLWVLPLSPLFLLPQLPVVICNQVLSLCAGKGGKGKGRMGKGKGRAGKSSTSASTSAVSSSMGESASRSVSRSDLGASQKLVGVSGNAPSRSQAER